MRRTSLVVALLLGLAGLGTITSAHAEGTGVLQGVVTDAHTGQPVNGIYVSAVPDGTDDFRTVQTDSDGRWSLELATSTYRVGFRDFFSGKYREQWAIGKPDQASADPISVADGSDRVIDVALAPLPTVSGRITDSTGAPVVGFCPSFVLGDPAAVNAHGGACTDAGGRYTHGIPTTGTYRVHFKDYFAPYADQWYRSVTNADDATTFEVTETSAITGIDALLQPQATITTGITDTDGAPLRGCATAYDLQGRSAGNGCTDYDSPGPVTITGLPAGTYVIHAQKESIGHHVSRYLGGTTTAKKATRVTVTTGEAKTVPAVALPLGGSVTGTVRDAATGAPIKSACVTTTGHYDAREGHGYGSEGPGTACTDATGRYTVWALETGSYPVEMADAFGTHANLFLPSSPDSRGTKTYKVVLGTATVLDAALADGGSISGQLTMADGGAPDYTCVIAYAAVTHEQIGHGGCADATGAYTITELGTNDYKLEVYGVPPGYAKTFYPGVPTYQKASTVTVTAGQPISDVNITVPHT